MVTMVTFGILFIDSLQLHVGPPVVSFSTVKILFNSSAPTECQLDDLAFSPCKSPYQHLNLKSGQHSVTIKATDDAGCVKKNSITFYIGGKCVFKCNYKCSQSMTYRTRSTKDYINIS